MSLICEYCNKEYKYASSLSKHNSTPTRKCELIRKKIKESTIHNDLINSHNNDIEQLKMELLAKDKRISALEETIIHLKDLIKNINGNGQLNNIDNVNIDNMNIDNKVNIIINVNRQDTFNLNCFDPDKFTIEYAERGIAGLVDYVSDTLMIDKSKNLHNYVCIDKDKNDFQYLKGCENTNNFEWVRDHDAHLLTSSLLQSLNDRSHYMTTSLKSITSNPNIEQMRAIDTCSKINDKNGDLIKRFTNKIKDKVYISPSLLNTIQLEEQLNESDDQEDTFAIEYCEPGVSIFLNDPTYPRLSQDMSYEVSVRVREQQLTHIENHSASM